MNTHLSPDQRSLIRLRVLLIAGGLVFIAGLAALAYPGLFVRFLADDYCVAGMVQKSGLWATQAEMYRAWSGRYTATFAASLLQLLGPNTPAVFTWFLIFLWLGGLASLIARLNRALWLRFANVGAVCFAALVLFITLLITPNRFQVSYWLMGQVTYTLPLVGITLLMNWIASLPEPRPGGKQRVMALSHILLVAFLLGGTSETYVAFQTGLFALALVWTVLLLRPPVSRSLALLLSAGLLASLISMAVIISAPGNAARQALLPQPPALPRLIQLSLLYAAGFLRDTLKAFPLPLLVAAAVPLLGGFLTTRPQALPPSLRRRLLPYLLAPLSLYLLVVCICAPSVYGESAAPEARSLLAGVFLLVLTAAGLGLWSGVLLRSWLNRAAPAAVRPLFIAAFVVLGVLCLYPTRAGFQIMSQLRPAQQYAQAWDNRHRLIVANRLNGILNQSVPALNSQAGLMELGDDPNLWVNRCAADYYHLDSITAR